MPELDDQLKDMEIKVQKVDFLFASAKQRKSMKKNKIAGDEFKELNDNDVDLGQLYG